ncbi:MAG: nucleotidyltransferase substrate binding protein [Defluviitaleaceae bacterium]|nr:nucleotidyltransferase substrate binding protein [Defluviitaleaceae bacterium]
MDDFLRFKQRKETYSKSLALLLRQSEKEELDEANIGATLHFFNLTFELSWNMLKDYLYAQGTEVRSPRDAIKSAFQAGYIDNENHWLDMIKSRNLIAHAYDMVMAEKLVVEVLERYLKLLVKLGEDADVWAKTK